VDGRGFEFDERNWPLIIATCAERLEDASVRQLTSFFEGIHARKELFALMVDTRPVKTMPSARWRKELSAWSSDARVQLNTARYNVATAVVISSAFARGVYTALGWMWKPASPTSPMATVAMAIDWCCDHLGRAGVARSATLIELQRSFHEEDGGAGAGTSRSAGSKGT
jgi:hypothetical protein